ncbi:triose-phosphate isomerase [Brevundimonas sp. PAMC22021]|uniref:triose-phosphate isomerase n=1 Tax=Brevundimonas sp. PAMC22021 TaxID=2861285 RepID=UPI001C6295DD|nr:triose-phosphate isomerase [Brevundimonas sp. PAMC22021]QYF87937.1 triose-phosphate isomerase [Brevundimonas sp. PAMC22021]
MKQSVKMIVGNWKMNGLAAQIDEAREVDAVLRSEQAESRVVICPPATLIHRVKMALEGGRVEVGGQDCHAESCGAFTGSASAEMLADAGATLVILGHSERRDAFRESDADVSAKVESALAYGLEPIICVGERSADRDTGRAVEVVTAQVAGSLPASLEGKAFAVAYEPIWAIGTGRTPTTGEIAEVHAAIRQALVDRFGEGGRAAPILYGGSVNPGNAAAILRTPDVGGALVGGASLKAHDFLAIIRAAH